MWSKVITFMASISFMVNFYYIYGWCCIYNFYLWVVQGPVHMEVWEPGQVRSPALVG